MQIHTSRNLLGTLAGTFAIALAAHAAPATNAATPAKTAPATTKMSSTKVVMTSPSTAHKMAASTKGKKLGHAKHMARKSAKMTAKTTKMSAKSTKMNTKMTAKTAAKR